MHSNLGSVSDIEELENLPERIRPKYLGFGTLADGYVPFAAGAAGVAEGFTIQMPSLVMKVVQARCPGCAVTSRHFPREQTESKESTQQQASAIKLGDDVSLSKMQLDPRLTHQQKEDVKRRVIAMAADSSDPSLLDSGAISKVIDTAYCDVTQRKIM